MGAIQLSPTGPATAVATDDAVDELALLVVPVLELAALLVVPVLATLLAVEEGVDDVAALELELAAAAVVSILNQLRLKPPVTALMPKVCLPAESTTARLIVTHVCQSPVAPTLTVS